MPRTNTELKNLVDAKIAVIDFHEGDSLAYLRQQIARDACYTSKNGIDWKVQQMSEKKAELSILRSENAGSEVTSKKMSSTFDIYNRMNDELKELEERHQADLKVHNHFVGEAWTPNKKSKVTKSQQKELEEIDKLLAGLSPRN
jgi:hypothetical protein